MSPSPSRVLSIAALSCALAACGAPDEAVEDEEGDVLVSDDVDLPADTTTTTVTLANSRDAQNGIVRVIDAARTRLDIVQYVYIFNRAGTQAVNDAIQRAIARRVEVRVLLDDGVSDNANAVTQLRALGCNVKKDTTARVTHNKFVLADAKLFFAGSTNLSSESLQQNNEVNVVVSSSTQGAKLRAYFDAVWAKPGTPATIAQTTTGTKLLGDAQYGASAKAAIDAARTRVRLVMYATRYAGTARTLPIRDQLVDALRAAKARGVDVKVVLEKSTGAWDASVTSDNRNTATRLRSGGVEVRFDPPAVRTHAKLLVTDNLVHLGSSNWTSAALEDYHATDLKLRGTVISAKYAAWFDALWAQSAP